MVKVCKENKVELSRVGMLLLPGIVNHKKHLTNAKWTNHGGQVH